MVRELGRYKDEFFTGGATEQVIESLQLLVRGEVVRRIWAIDAGLYTSDADSAKGIPGRMGWLRAPEFMASHVASLIALAKQACADWVKQVLVLAVGPVAAAPRVLAECFADSTPIEMRVLNSIDPELVAEVDAWLDPEHTLLLILSKDGSELDLQCLEAHYFQRIAATLGVEAGSRFMAVTSPDSELAGLASRRRYARVFENPPDIPPRYSAISFYGLLPAAFLGVDLHDLTRDAKCMAESCSPATPIEQNAGFRLGSFIGGLAQRGRDRVTLLTSPELVPFARWVEMLLADGCARKGRGVFPLIGEPLQDAIEYGDDRLFIYLRLEGDRRTALDDLVDTLVAVGHPVARIPLTEKAELGGEFYRWQLAVAILASVLHINPFDEPLAPLLQRATRQTAAVMAAGGTPAAFEAVPPDGEQVGGFLRGLTAKDHLLISAQFAPSAERRAAFMEMRVRLRERWGVLTSQGFGAAFASATLQMQTGGPPGVAGLVLVGPCPAAGSIAEHELSFGMLREAQVAGQMQLLRTARRRVLCVRMGPDIDAAMRLLNERLMEL